MTKALIHDVLGVQHGIMLTTAMVEFGILKDLNNLALNITIQINYTKKTWAYCYYGYIELLTWMNIPIKQQQPLLISLKRFPLATFNSKSWNVVMLSSRSLKAL